MLAISPDTLAKIAANELCLILVPEEDRSVVFVMEDSTGVRAIERLSPEQISKANKQNIEYFFEKMLLTHKRLGK